MSMQPFFKAGQVYILGGELDFINEYEAFPRSMTVDILDAMAYAFKMLAPQIIDVKHGIEEDLKDVEDYSTKRFWRAEFKSRLDLDEHEEEYMSTSSDDAEDYSEDLEEVGEFV